MFLSSGLMEGGSTTGGGGTGGTGGPARETERREKSRINYRRHERAMSAQASNFPLPSPPAYPPHKGTPSSSPILLKTSPLLASFLPALPSSSHLVFMIAVLSPLWPFLSAPSLPSLFSPLFTLLPLSPSSAKKISSHLPRPKDRPSEPFFSQSSSVPSSVGRLAPCPASGGTELRLGPLPPASLLMLVVAAAGLCWMNFWPIPPAGTSRRWQSRSSPR